MRYRTDGRGLDKLTTPIIMCNMKGFVIYKNDIAVKQIRLPKRNTDMITHLSSIGKKSLEDISETSKPCVISVYTGDGFARAFVTTYQRDEQDCTLWMFPAFLQMNPSSAFFSALSKDIERLGPDFFDIIKQLDRKGTVLPGRSQNAIQNRIEQRLSHMLDELLSSRPERANWSVSESLYILKEHVSKVFIQHDYRIDYSEEIAPSHRHKYLNFRDFVAFYTHALTFCCELTRNRTIALDARSAKGEEMIEFRIRFTVLFPPFFTESWEKDLNKLLPSFPDHKVDIMLFDKLVKFCGYEVAYSITEKPRDNVEVLFRVPLTIKRGFSAPGNKREPQLVYNDCTNYLYISLITSNFHFESEPNLDE